MSVWSTVQELWTNNTHKWTKYLEFIRKQFSASFSFSSSFLKSKKSAFKSILFTCDTKRSPSIHFCHIKYASFKIRANILVELNFFPSCKKQPNIFVQEFSNKIETSHGFLNLYEIELIEFEINVCSAGSFGPFVNFYLKILTLIIRFYKNKNSKTIL